MKIILDTYTVHFLGQDLLYFFNSCWCLKNKSAQVIQIYTQKVRLGSYTLNAKSVNFSSHTKTKAALDCIGRLPFTALTVADETMRLAILLFNQTIYTSTS